MKFASSLSGVSLLGYYYQLMLEKSTTLTCTEDTAALRGLFHGLEKILLSRRRRFHWAEPFFFMGTGSGGMAAILILFGLSAKNKVLIVLGSVSGAIVVTAILIFLGTMPMRRSQVLLISRSESRSFWQRNKDTIIVAYHEHSKYRRNFDSAGTRSLRSIQHG